MSALFVTTGKIPKEEREIQRKIEKKEIRRVEKSRRINTLRRKRVRTRVKKHLQSLPKSVLLSMIMDEYDHKGNLWNYLWEKGIHSAADYMDV